MDHAAERHTWMGTLAHDNIQDVCLQAAAHPSPSTDSLFPYFEDEAPGAEGH